MWNCNGSVSGVSDISSVPDVFTALQSGNLMIAPVVYQTYLVATLQCGILMAVSAMYQT